MDLNLFKHAEGATHVAAGEVVFQQGDIASEMYIVLSGQVELLVNAQSVDVLGSGAIFGEMALVDDPPHPRSATAVTRADSVLLAINAERFVQLVQLAPSFALDVVRSLAGRLRAMDERL